jgi:hypothetical protein
MLFICHFSLMQLHAFVEYETIEDADKAVSISLYRYISLPTKLVNKGVPSVHSITEIFFCFF